MKNRTPLANRAFCPAAYDKQYERGREAQANGEFREPKTEHGFCFDYSYEGGAWLDGYDGLDKQVSS
jgi:hypothetical protein